MHPIALAPQATPSANAPPKKLLHVAEQFETVLLNDLLGPLEKTFSSLPGEKDSPGSSDYSYLGTQALASALAASGGFGIAAMIVRNLMKNNKVMSNPRIKPGLKFPRPGADKLRISR